MLFTDRSRLRAVLCCEVKLNNGMMPHTHLGYEHNEIGDRQLTDKEQKYVSVLLNKWERKHLNI